MLFSLIHITHGQMTANTIRSVETFEANSMQDAVAKVEKRIGKTGFATFDLSASMFGSRESYQITAIRSINTDADGFTSIYSG